ncbi:MAG: tRNA (adenosine(37)-N6)-threonylcarbamoyltransferase complex transferase subunit TsaD [Chloroflexi bacterium]|nr:tRNA (adenosine(37)-N6)-threonylcarbamoyltransferase complex transferase subunit TsaD [Chloroflexota bacterium]
MNILAIESSCDETAAAVVADGRRVLSDIVASQIDIHAAFGGVVPEVASRQHLLWIAPVIEQALSKANVALSDMDAIAVTKGPGLAGSLLVGVNAAKALAFARGLPLIGINHLEGHIYANWLTENEPSFPLVCLIVSGGHTDMILMRGHGQYQLLGRTRDDAAGEAFDKVARILGLGYPGGPAIQEAGQKGTDKHVGLPRAWLRSSYDFSFSGLKTAVLRLVEELRQEGTGPTSCEESASGGEGAETAPLRAGGPLRPHRPVGISTCDIAAAFQEAVVDVLVEKTRKAAEEFGVRQVLLAGGVAANSRLRSRMSERIPVALLRPPPNLCTDNAAMIGSCAYYRFQAGQRDGLNLDVSPNLKLV